MRIRSTERPPTKEDVIRIVKDGASEDDRVRFRQLLRRLQKASFIDTRYRTVPARERLIQRYKKDGLVLFLGAGVSVGSGIPNWPNLADTLLRKSGLPTRKLGAVKKALPSYITQFELAGELLVTYGDLVKAIYEGLYERLTCKSQLEEIPRRYEDQIGWDGWPAVLESLQTNETLRSVGDLLISDGATGPTRNRQIHAVLTFNADNLLELYCEAKTGGKRVLTLVDRASVGEHPDQIPIYHLHGTLDARGENLFRHAPTSVRPDELQELTDDLLPDLVFRECEYYGTIANPVSFVNQTPQSFLRRLNALFIGTSLDDLNMRRWLRNSFRERVQHRTSYLREFYWKEYMDAEYEAQLESRRHFWLRPETERGRDRRPWRVPKVYVESVMSNLGVQVVWCKDYNFVRQCLGEMQRRGYDPEFGRRAAEYPG